MLGESFTDGFLVMQRGRILAEWYDGSLTPSKPHIIFSVSKSVTGTLTGVLAEEGRLDPEALVTRYIPEAAGSAYGDCTVRHVLDMTVSTDFVEDYLDPHGDFARYRIATGWNPVDPAKATDLRSFLVTMRRGKAAHGENYHYVSPNSDLMGWILERACGRAYAELLSEALWQPMGAEFEAYTAVDRLGAARPAGGICVTLRDLARFGEMMRNRGVANGRQVIPGWWVEDIRNNGDSGPWTRWRPPRSSPRRAATAANGMCWAMTAAPSAASASMANGSMSTPRRSSSSPSSPPSRSRWTIPRISCCSPRSTRSRRR
jgi:CubicO group peptidase (beta-lactamase class C family)